MYHDNPVINNIVLTIINDGNGSECGRTYAERCEIAASGLVNMFFNMARKASKYTLPIQDANTAAFIVYDYYVNHNNENAAHSKTAP